MKRVAGCLTFGAVTGTILALAIAASISEFFDVPVVKARQTCP